MLMLEEGDDYFYPENEFGYIQKLKDLFRTAKVIIDSMETCELPVAFRMAFNLLERTGKIICLSKLRSANSDSKCYLVKKRRHSSCSHKNFKNESKENASPSNYLDALRYTPYDNEDMKNLLGATVKITDDISAEGKLDNEFLIHPFSNSPEETNDFLEISSQGIKILHSGSHLSKSQLISNLELPFRSKYFAEIRQTVDPEKSLNRYPHCASAPVQSSTDWFAKKVNIYHRTQKEQKGNTQTLGSRNHPRGDLSCCNLERGDSDSSKKRLNQAVNLNRNWKISHSDKLNTLIDECERIMDGRKVFKCKFCGKMYDIKSSMRYHMKIIHLQMHLHTSEMQCRICGKQFTCISAVNRHQLKCSANSISTYINSQPIQSLGNTISQKDNHQNKKQLFSGKYGPTNQHSGYNFNSSTSTPSNEIRWQKNIPRSENVASIYHNKFNQFQSSVQAVSPHDLLVPRMLPQLANCNSIVSSREEFNFLLNPARDSLHVDKQDIFMNTNMSKYGRVSLNHSVQNLVEDDSRSKIDSKLMRVPASQMDITGDEHISIPCLSSPNPIKSSRVGEFEYGDIGCSQISDFYFKQVLKKHADATAIDLSLNASMAC